MADAGEVTVSLRDAGLLAHALVARCLEDIDGRGIVLKGVGAELHGLRRRRTSADVDVLVPPADLDAMRGALRRRGWRERRADPDEVAFPVHSVSFYHPTWPCDIDVHFRFPGLEAAPAVVFERLWERRESLPVAGWDVDVPGAADSFVILTVHALRSPWVHRHREELASLAPLAPRIGPPALLEAATRLGALACARPVLEPLVPAGSVEWGKVSDEWAVRTGFRDPFARRLLSFRRASWRRRLRLVWSAVLPPREVVIGGAGSRGVPWLLRLYLRRWGRGVVALPRAFVAMRGVDAGGTASRHG